MTTIKLDIDGKKIDWERIRSVVQIFQLDIDYIMSRICKTKNGYHLYLELQDDINDKQLCFIQLAMGSDYKRELLNWKRIVSGDEWQRREWNVLFAKKFHVDVATSRKKLASQEIELSNEIIWESLHEL